jgi:hypothetical protein
MQGKALATALLVFLCLLAGCGGGWGGQSQSAPEGTAPSVQSGPSAAQATSPQGAEEAASRLKDNTAQIKHEREGHAQASQGTGSTAGKEEEEVQAKLPPAQPKNTHHDSGGGTAQFATKRGDNSIQESGKEGSPAETQAAAAVLHAYLDARVAHRWADACFYLSAGYAATIEAFAERYAKGKGVMGCAEVLEAFATGSSQRVLLASARADVGALRIEGDHGFLLYRGAGGEDLAMPMVLEGGAWKVGSLDGAPLG